MSGRHRTRRARRVIAALAARLPHRRQQVRQRETGRPIRHVTVIPPGGWPR